MSTDQILYDIVGMCLLSPHSQKILSKNEKCNMEFKDQKL